MTNKCERCGIKREGQYYMFYYGNFLDSTNFAHESCFGTATTITTKYAIAGKASCFLCERCVIQRGLKDFLKIPVCFLIGVTVMIFIKYFKITEIWPLLFYLPIAIIVGSTIIFLRFLIDLKWTGNVLSITVKYKEYGAMGYDSLFTPREYKKLHPELPNL